MEVVATSSLRDRALRLPEGLTVKECAAVLKIDVQKCRKLLKSIYYKPRDRRKEHMTPEKKIKQWHTDWNVVDWNKKDAAIVRETGVSRQSVAKRRKAMT